MCIVFFASARRIHIHTSYAISNAHRCLYPIYYSCVNLSLLFVYPPQTQKLYAKAIYENIAESPDELAFKRGDVLTVIEQDTDGLTGWWLCSLRERTVTTTFTYNFP